MIASERDVSDFQHVSSLSVGCSQGIEAWAHCATHLCTRDIAPSAIVCAVPGPISGPAANNDRNANDVEVLLQRRAQSDQGRALSRRVRACVRTDPGRHPQGRSAQAGVSRDQSERKSAGHRRWRRRRVRQQRDPALSRREDRQVSAGEHPQGARRAAVVADVRCVRGRSLFRAGSAFPQLRAGEAALRGQSLRVRGTAPFRNSR